MAVGRGGGTELVQQGAGHDRVLVVAEQVLELLGLPAQPPGRFAEDGGGDLGHVPELLVGIAGVVQRLIPLRPRGQGLGGDELAVERAQRLGDVLGQFLGRRAVSRAR